MLIVPAEIARKIDENRGDMSQADFISFLIDSHFHREEPANGQYVTVEEFHAFERSMKELFRSFLDFFLSVGVEMETSLDASQPGAFSHRLQNLEEQLESEDGEARAKIRWK